MQHCLASSFKLALVVAIVVSARGARAQAWVGDTGSLNADLSYNLGISTQVKAANQTFDDAGTTSHQLTLAAEYVPIKALAVSLQLPFLMIKYTGSKTLYPHPGATYDDGSLHKTLTDLRAGVRYQLLDDPVALSPHIAASIPVADYATVGNAVAGRHLKALHLGLSVGKVFGEATYAHLLYEFSLIEKLDVTPDTAKHSQNRNDVSLTIGHKLLEQKLDLHIDADFRKSMGGVDLDDLGVGLSESENMYHDAILAEDILLVGGGLGYQITDKLSANLSGRAFITGKNAQKSTIVAVGLSWSPL